MKTRRSSAEPLAALRTLCLTAFAAIAAPAAAAPVILQNATATFTQQDGFAISQSIDGNLGGTGVVNGWAIAPVEAMSHHAAVYETQTDVGGPGGATLTFTLTQNFGSKITLGCFRLSVTEDDRVMFADGLNIGGDVTANWFTLAPVTALATNGATLTIQPDQSILASGVSPATTVYTVTALTDSTKIKGIRLEAIEDPSLPSNGPGRELSGGNFVLQEFAVDAVAISDPPNADFDENGVVNGDDLTRWLANFGTGATHLQGNADGYLGDMDVDGRDFLVWQRQFGGPPPSTQAAAASVPEPATSMLVIVAAAGVLRVCSRMRRA